MVKAIPFHICFHCEIPERRDGKRFYLKQGVFFRFKHITFLSERKKLLLWSSLLTTSDMAIPLYHEITLTKYYVTYSDKNISHLCYFRLECCITKRWAHLKSKIGHSTALHVWLEGNMGNVKEKVPGEMK